MKSLRLIFLICASVASILMISPVAAQQISTPLPVGGVLQQFVDTATRSRQYRFDARADESVFLLVVSDDYEDAPAIVISDAITNENIATAKTAVSAICMRFGPGGESYTMNISAENPDGLQWYGVALTSGDPSELSCPQELVNTFIDGFSAAKNGLTLGNGLNMSNVNCNASSGANVGVNVRSGNNSTAPIIGSVQVDSLVPVVGVTPDAERLLVVLPGGSYGFASGNILAISGDCSTVPTVTVDNTTVNGTDNLLDLNGLINPDTNVGGLDTEAITDLTGLDTSDATNLNLLNVDTNGSAEGNDFDVNLGQNEGNALIEVNSDTNANGGSGGSILDINAAGNDVVDANGSADGSTNTCINALGIEIIC